jgi:hypothetical protein
VFNGFNRLVTMGIGDQVGSNTLPRNFLLNISIGNINYY